jgi:hypothetical protein
MNPVTLHRFAMNSRLVFAALFLSLGIALALYGQAEKRTEGKTAARAASVSTFGAVGDGAADDTAAIQRAVDSGEGTVRFAKGDYRITKTIAIDLRKVGPTALVGDGTARIVMAGPGPAFHILGSHEGSAAPKTFKEEYWQRERSPMVDGLEIVGEHAESEGILLEGTMQATLTRVVVRKALHGIRLFKRNRNVTIGECHLYDNRGIGIYLDRLNLHQIDIANTHISYNKGGGVVVRASEIRNLHIGTCDIESNHDADGPATANVFFDCTTGSVREGAIVGCTIQHTNLAPDSANIRFLGRAEQPLMVGNFAIADNVFSDVQVGVHLKYARGVTLTGNTFWQSVKHNLLVEGSSHIVLSGNLCDRNPDYAHQPFNTSNAVEFVDCQDCTISGLQVLNTIKAPAGVVVRRSKRFNITGCTLLDCEGPELLLEDVSDSRVSDCLLRDDRPDAKDGAPLVETRGKGNQLVDNSLGKGG